MTRRRTVRSRLTERTAERAEKACGSSAEKRRGERAFEASRVGKPRVRNCPVGEENNRATRTDRGRSRPSRARRAIARSRVRHRSPSIAPAANARAVLIAGRTSHRRARATRGNDDVDERVLLLGTEGISTRTFFATTLVFLAAARLAETPRVVKAPARAEAEAMFVVCGCCDAVCEASMIAGPVALRARFPLLVLRGHHRCHLEGKYLA